MVITQVYVFSIYVDMNWYDIIASLSEIESSGHQWQKCPRAARIAVELNKPRWRTQAGPEVRETVTSLIKGWRSMYRRRKQTPAMSWFLGEKTCENNQKIQMKPNEGILKIWKIEFLECLKDVFVLHPTGNNYEWLLYPAQLCKIITEESGKIHC